MSFVYPRTVAVTRPTQEAGIGAVGYGGQMPGTEDPVATDLPASIQFRKAHGGNEAGLPGDAGRSGWRILIPKGAAALGLIQARDIVTDDLGDRYQVAGAYWNSLGYNLSAERLEA